MHNQPREPQLYEDCQAKSIQEFGWISQGMDWGWCQYIKSHHTLTCQGYSCCIPLVKPLLNHWQRQSRLSWAKEKKNWTVAQWSKVLFSDESRFQIKSNHFYCHITTAQVPWWVKFLWACSRQCKKTTDNLHMDRQCKKKLHWSIYSAPDSAKKPTTILHMDSTYLQTVQKTMWKIHIHILSTHSVL